MRTNLIEQFTLYWLPFDDLTEEAKQYYDRETDVDEYGNEYDLDYINAWGNDIADFSRSDYQEFDSDGLADYLLEQFDHPYDSYLCQLVRANWRGSSAYKVVTNISEVFNFEEDFSLYLEGSSGNVVKLRFSSHDVYDSEYYIIGLDENEKEYLDDYDTTLEQIDRFISNEINDYEGKASGEQPRE